MIDMVFIGWSLQLDMSLSFHRAALCQTRLEINLFFDANKHLTRRGEDEVFLSYIYDYKSKFCTAFIVEVSCVKQNQIISDPVAINI